MCLCCNPFLSLKDAELIDKIICGDGEALVFLLTKRCGPSLKYLCLQNRASQLDLMDLVQDVAIKLMANDFRALRDFKGFNQQSGRTCGLQHYVYVIARRHIQRVNKRAMKENASLEAQGKQDNVLPSDDANETPELKLDDFAMKTQQHWTPVQVRREIDWTSAFTDANGRVFEVPGDGHRNAELRMEIMDAIMMLDDSRERFILMEYKIKGYTPAEVAAALGTTEGNIYTICCRAQKKLRSMLTDNGSHHA